MTTPLDKAYDPKQVETKWYQFWLDQKLFAANEKSKKKPYCIVIPPPNVTGALHMGHALNNTLQDVLIRWRRMQGFEALWQPGTDHAGIATQNVVEREILKNEGKTRHQVGRETLIQRIWDWKEQYGDRIIKQLHALGASCDWSRTRFTMDEGLSKAVREAFVTLHERGLIYRGNYIVNWCPRCQTALADDEVEHEEKKGSLWHIRYGDVIVATTRPETMLGDVAVAVNPKDKRYATLRGRTLVLPEVGREIPVIADDFVDPKFGTGCVKVTPAHDPNDFQMGLRHKLAQINVMNADATMNQNVPEKYRGMTREVCRKILVKNLEAQGLIEKIEEHVHSVGHCYRCNTVIEPWLSLQWFVKMKPLAKKAITATKTGKVKFVPKRWEKFYLSWLENVRDWCISRQIWWGHRIPVWYCQGENLPGDGSGSIPPEQDLIIAGTRRVVEGGDGPRARQDPSDFRNSQCQPIVARSTPKCCPNCGSKNLEQDPDVLDTWFSSWLWPFSTLGWPEQTPTLKKFYPNNVLSTDRGIIFFWVARMVMAGLEFIKKAPFRHVYIHGTILDENGQKMSKSKPETCIDPIDIIEKYGADALRYSLLLMTTEGQDLTLAESRFQAGRHFCNKLWNATRFALMNLENYDGKPDSVKNLSLADRWIWNRLQQTIQKVNVSLEKFDFYDAAQGYYQFVWNEFCDWYLEAIKPAVGNSHATQWNLARVLETILRLGHPFMPFITEELWQNLGKQKSSIMIQDYPKGEKKIPFAKEAKEFSVIQEVVGAIRNLRGEHKVNPKQKISASARGKGSLAILKRHASAIQSLALLSTLTLIKDKPEQSAMAVAGDIEIFVPLSELVDVAEERRRLEKEIAKENENLQRLLVKLSNRAFIERAPKAIVEKEQACCHETKERISRLEAALSQIQ